MPYSVTESNAVDSRLAGMPSASRWKRRLVRNGSPSPANIRVGSSFSRLNANTPPVNGKLPGTFSSSCQRRISPSSSKRGSATLGIFVPDNDVVVSAVRISRSRILTTYSSPPYAALVCGHISRSFFARASSFASRSAARWSSAVRSVLQSSAAPFGSLAPRARSLHSAASIRFASRSCCRSRASFACAAAQPRYARCVSAISAR